MPYCFCKAKLTFNTYTMLRRISRIRNRGHQGLLERDDMLISESDNLRYLHHREVNFPPANVVHHDEYFDLEIAVPGCKKEDLEVYLVDRILTIAGKSESDVPVENLKFVKEEHDTNRLERSFILEDYTDLDNIVATYEEGMVKIRLYHLQNIQNENAIKRSIPIG